MTTKCLENVTWHNELLPNVVDHLAKVSPTAPYALYPNSPNTYDDGYRTVTYKDFANAINGFAWWLTKTLGPSENSEIVAYVGPNDVRYTALMLGAVKAGYVAFFTSPRNSISAHGVLFNKLKCRTLLTPNPALPVIEHILNAHPMKHLHVPSVEDLLDKVYPHYSFNKTLEQARTEPFGIIHTSGSTGIPKPLIWTHETVARHLNFSTSGPMPGFQSIDRLHQGKRMINAFPPFHGACIVIQVIYSIGYGTVSVAPLSGAIPTAEGMVQALKITSAEVAFLVPSIISDLSQKAELLDYCARHLELMLYTGGDLPQAIGDKIAAKVHFRCQYGSSETGIAAQLIAPGMTRADWRYIMFHPDLGIEFEETTPGMFELILKRDPEYETCLLPFTIGPSLHDLQVYRTKDLFVKHPTIPDCWGWRARADDIIVFLNGEKTNPVSMEQHIMAKNPSVSAVLAVGMQRFQASLLVESATTLESPEEVIAFIETIWPSINEANKVAPAHARVEKSMVLLTSRDKPMIRAGKGTIQRQATVTQYANEIDDLYLRAKTELSGTGRASVDTKDATQVSNLLKQVIIKIEPDLLQEGANNFFALGMDSLMAMRIIRALRHGLGRPELEVSVVYNNPSLQSLTQYIVHGGDTKGADHSMSHKSEMESLLREYEQKIQASPRSAYSKNSGETVILTGSTGSLGFHLLEALLANPGITQIYCLNRRSNAQKIHEAKATAANLPLNKQMARVTFLHAMLHEPNFGLDDKTFSLLHATATLIIHNAWTVNFTHPLHTFRPQLDGLINLFNFTSTRKDPANLFYISSISSVAELPRPSRSALIPEEIIRDFEAPFDIGYAQSKLLAELLCDTAARRLKIPVSFARVGQIAGPVNGETALWNTAEWLPSLIQTSISLGALPDDLGAELNKVDWMPVDMLAQVMVELGMNPDKGENAHDSSLGAVVFNLLNPKPTSWTQILPSLASSIQMHSGKHMDVVPKAVWLDTLRQITMDLSADETHLVRTHPAIKLQGFYEARMRADGHANNWELSRAVAKSKTLKEMPAVGNEWTEKWVQAWVATLR